MVLCVCRTRARPFAKVLVVVEIRVGWCQVASARDAMLLLERAPGGEPYDWRHSGRRRRCQVAPGPHVIHCQYTAAPYIYLQ